MMNMTFSPKMRSGVDAVEKLLLVTAQYLLIGAAALLPILFIPHSEISLGFTKSFFVLVSALLVLIVFSLFILRVGLVRIAAPTVLLAMWGIGIVAVASALLSGDRLDAMVGDALQIQTAAFFLLMALMATVTAAVIDSKGAVIRFFCAAALVALLLQLWHVLRILFGPDTLTFGVFNSATVSPIGSFNDLAIFSGLVIILSLVALLQLSLRRYALWCVIALVGLSLVLLSVINFFIVWVIVGFFSLLSFLYTLTKDRLFTTSVGSEVVSSPSTPRFVFIIIGVICAVSAVFIIAGAYVGSALNNALEIQYVEVRPSFSTTLDIIGSTYKDNHALFGIGPNRFEDAWRLYKNPVINDTIFWNTNFNAGSGYVTTSFVTLGIVGGIAFIIFLVSLLYVGVRTLLVSNSSDSFWYVTATASFAASGYLWLMAVLYVPGTTLLLLAAFWTGLSLVSYAQLMPNAQLITRFTHNRPRAFVLMAIVMLVITGAVGSLFVVSKQFAGHIVYANAIKSATISPDMQAADASLARATQLFKSDLFLTERVRLRFATLGNLLNTTNPTPEDLQLFQTNAVEALQLARTAVDLDGTNPSNHSLLASIYGVLAITPVANARELVTESFARAKVLDPQNPEYSLIEAQIATRLNDFTAARNELNKSLQIKPNYVDALYLLSQLDVSEGNTDAAIDTARAIITIEPQNPSRYFQLGSLLVAAKNLGGAREAYEAAITLDPNFANARYLLALVHLEEGKRAEALVQLKIVASTNPDNTGLQDLIASVESGANARPVLGITPPVNENEVQVDEDGVATTEGETDTDLIVPVNQSGTNQADRANEETGE